TFFVLTISLFLLSACKGASSGAQKPTLTSFSCQAAITYQGLTIKGKLSRQAAGTLTLDITEPPSLAGMTMSWDGQTVTLKMNGLSFGVDPATVPQTALGKVIINALDAAVGKKDGTLTPSGYEVSGSDAGGSFTLVSDPDTGALLTLTVPSADLTAVFSDFAWG
ncbi:MAG: hypothetical protein FWF49_02655, partial [Oscillospiraceae bacterium]|nr:hypothetical protein [Oscillospiraceae bacterium]